MITQPAPIAFFAYKRPKLTLQSLTSLAANPGAKTSRLFVFCDGPRTAVDEPLVRQVREVVRSRQWCSQVAVIEQKSNLGLARSIISGVTQLVEEFGRVIVLEDDLLVSKGFLDYMNCALEQYQNAEQVYQISGHMFPALDLSSEDDAFFMPMITSWGWATWKRAWAAFDPYAIGYEELKTNQELRNQFDLNGSYAYTAMLLAQMSGKIDSWAIRWWWSVFRAGGLSLFPKYSLIRNIGFSVEATHTKHSLDLHNDPQWFEERCAVRLPNELIVDQTNFEQVCKYLLLSTSHSPFIRVTRSMKKLSRWIWNRLRLAHAS